MAEKSSFFNSIAGDRMYQASDFASYFNSLITNGVFPNPSTNLQIISNDDMTATVKVGKAWINGYVYINDSDLILPIEVADGILNRIDRIVIRFDTVGRLISTVVKKGTFASSPVAPTLVRDADFYELGIADIYIVNGATSIVQGDITDVKEVLGVDVAANLLVKIDDNTAALATHSADYTRNPGYAVDTGVANAYVVTLNPAPTAYVDGMRVMVKIVHSNTLTTCTLNVNGLGVKTLYKAIGTLFIGDIQINNMYELIYSAALGAFMLVGGDLDAIKLGGVAASGYATAAQGTKADNAIPLSQKGTVGGVASYDAVATSLAEIATKLINESGSNANGRYIKFEDGTLICENESFALTYNATPTFADTWTYPSGFNSLPTVLATLNGGNSTSGTKTDITNITYITKTTTSVQIQAYGTLDSGWVVRVDVLAIGRWK